MGHKTDDTATIGLAPKIKVNVRIPHWILNWQFFTSGSQNIKVEKEYEFNILSKSVPDNSRKLSNRPSNNASYLYNLIRYLKKNNINNK